MLTSQDLAMIRFIVRTELELSEMQRITNRIESNFEKLQEQMGDLKAPSQEVEQPSDQSLS